MRAWATLCTPYADDDQGLLVLPEVDSQVVVAFEAGNLRRPYVLGAAWNGKEALPHAPERANNIRLWRTRADSRLEFDDTPGSPAVRITMASGHEVVLDDGAQEITVKHAMGCTVKLTATDVEVNANVKVQVTAPMVEVECAHVHLQRDRQVLHADRGADGDLAGVHPGRREHLVRALR